MKITIKARFSDAIKIEGEYESTRHAAEQNRANLYGADLRGANLYGADLYGADLYGADLYGANLYGANLYGADLYGANLYGADLYGANLRGANLHGANLRGANLYGANLYGANLCGEILKLAPIQLYGLRWDVLITAEYMSIGCERHTHAEWISFKRTRISEMDSGAYGWWQKHRAMLLGLCEQHAEDAAKVPAPEKQAEAA